MAGEAAVPLLEAGDVRALEQLRLAHLGAILAGAAAAGRAVGPPGGRGVDFAEFRPYVPGDDVRLIDANVYARLGQAFVKTSPDDRDTGLLVLIDGSRSMVRPHADRLAALLGVVALLRGDGLRVAVLADGAARGGAGLRGPGAVGALLEELASLPRGRETSLAAGIRDARGVPTDLVVLITDALVEPPALAEAMDELSRAGRAAAVLQVIETAPAALGLSDGPVELVDAESGETATVSVTRAAYTSRLEALVARVHAVATAAGVGSTALPVEESALEQILALGRAGELLTRAG
jgi:uncharacterized protein (DUF58 family)